MELSKWVEKLNKVDGNVYVIEEEARLTNGVYEAELQHDNINVATLSVYAGPKLTGDRIESYVLSTPSMTPWKRVIRVYAEAPVVYISYETDGDTVEADDINRIQESVIETQKALNEEGERSLKAEERLAGDLQAEISRAGRGEAVLDNRITAETGRAKSAEQELKSNLADEKKRAETAETVLRTNLTAEVERATGEEQKVAGDLLAFQKDVITKEAIDALDGIDPEPGGIQGEPISIDEINNILSR